MKNNVRTQNNETEIQREDRLIDFRRVNELLGSRCRSAHFALRLAARGQIRAVTLNPRVVRYQESSVRDLIAGRTA
ncbi:MAG: hypothetical protein ACKODK_20995 [Opitutaceae bacterium]